MNDFRYVLEKYSGANSRFQCPSCKKREFAKYVDSQTGKYIHSTVGRCNRESSCQYHYTPKQYFQDNNIDTPNVTIPAVTLPQKSTSYIPVENFKGSLTGYENNNFIQFLVSAFDTEVATALISKYFIGTSKHWQGSTVFWQIDITGKVRTGKIMLYNAVTGKRVKEPHCYISWVHTALKLPEYNLKQALFGEHLLKDKSKPVAIVESEKTAIIASAYLPQFIWLAVGSINNLNPDKCQVLTGRKVILFPDLNAFNKWSSKAKELSHLASFTVSDLLERKATKEEREQGLDLADYLLRFYYKEFAELEPAGKVDKPLCDYQALEGFIKTSKPLENWLTEISELEHFFNVVKLPEAPFKLDSFRSIIDNSKFITSHLDIVKAKNGQERFKPYLERLRELEHYIKQHLN